MDGWMDGWIDRKTRNALTTHNQVVVDGAGGRVGRDKDRQTTGQ